VESLTELRERRAIRCRLTPDQALRSLAEAEAAAVDAVPALWSGPRPRGAAAIAPIRPPLGRPPK
jgi:hypothetical protein